MLTTLGRVALTNYSLPPHTLHFLPSLHDCNPVSVDVYFTYSVFSSLDQKILESRDLACFIDCIHLASSLAHSGCSKKDLLYK